MAKKFTEESEPKSAFVFLRLANIKIQQFNKMNIEEDNRGLLGNTARKEPVLSRYSKTNGDYVFYMQFHISTQRRISNITKQINNIYRGELL